MVALAESHVVRPPIEAIVFDLGGVFLDWNPRHLYRKLISDPTERERFLIEICSPEWHREQDRGRSIEVACRELAARHPNHARLIMAWWERNEEMVAGVVDDSVSILRELRRAGIPCFALSNMEPESFEVRRTRYGFMSEFCGFVISGEEGVTKPDPAIFQCLIDRFGLEPSRTLFIDDLRSNVEAARRLGFEAEQFTSPDALGRSLVDRGVLAR